MHINYGCSREEGCQLCKKGSWHPSTTTIVEYITDSRDHDEPETKGNSTICSPQQQGRSQHQRLWQQIEEHTILLFPIIIIASTQIILSCHLDRHTVSSRQAYLSPLPQGARPGFCGAVGQWDFVLHKYRQATQCLLATSTLVSAKSWM